jgi:hypothetical protein
MGRLKLDHVRGCLRGGERYSVLPITTKHRPRFASHYLPACNRMNTHSTTRLSLSYFNMARLSARSSASRDQPSSPPKQPSHRQSQSPVGRRTRSTRSQSAELGESAIATTTRREGKRGARQASVESLDSNASAGSGRGGRARKATRTAGQARGQNLFPDIQTQSTDFSLRFIHGCRRP